MKLIFNADHYYEKNSREYGKDMEILVMLIHLISNLIYFHQGFTQRHMDFLTNYLNKLYKNGLITFNTDTKYEKINQLVKKSFMILLKDNLYVYKLNNYHFLSECTFNFGNLISEMEKNLFNLNDKIALSQILVTYLKKNMIEIPEKFSNNSILEEINEEIFKVFCKEKGHMIFDEQIKKKKLSEFTIS